jgi:hypothetical protein
MELNVSLRRKNPVISRLSYRHWNKEHYIATSKILEEVSAQRAPFVDYVYSRSATNGSIESQIHYYIYLNKCKHYVRALSHCSV